MDTRVYGGDDGHWAGPSPGRVYVSLMGGPLDGQLYDVTGWSGQEREVGALLITDRGLFGPGGRAFYRPSATDPGGPFLWDSDTP
ncbi:MULTISPECIES: hypothetical protein [unclassified Streptomyces]|uniref:hypothetical protein n=1 Tax=Streptomyces sp. NPDC058612 TaxID=3346555 RepID=UPI00226DB5AF|nr:hypothetical protein [Streptomyces sp. H34-S5]MCY0945485.1 hypothetical protein [Streptomyces sp. H34-AA3]MCY0953120.1 hypothetical protein [Streptomyces sp. H27-S2]MCZ4083606.1 hypothetical protein [Streptomyces sp. H34-S5]